MFLVFPTSTSKWNSNSLSLSYKKQKTKTARELGKARRCAEVSGNAAGARLWDRLPVPAGGAFESVASFRCLEVEVFFNGNSNSLTHTFSLILSVSLSLSNPGWKPAPKSLGEDDPKSIMAWLSDGGNGKAAPSATTVSGAGEVLSKTTASFFFLLSFSFSHLLSFVSVFLLRHSGFVSISLVV